jgi:hypothetical protein
MRMLYNFDNDIVVIILKWCFNGKRDLGKIREGRTDLSKS